MEQHSQGHSDGIRKKATSSIIRLTPKRPVARQNAVSHQDSEMRAGSEFLGHWQEHHSIGVSKKSAADSVQEPDRDTTFSPREDIPTAIRAVHHHPAAYSRARIMYAGVIAGVLAVAGAFGAMTTVWARLTIVVKPKIENVSLRDIAVVFDTAATKVHIPQKMIPAEKLSFSKTVTREFTATGKDSGAERARGTVRITNLFSSSPQPLVAGTRFLTPGGTLFRLTKTITVPGATTVQGKFIPQSIDTEVAADVPGEEHNLSGQIQLTIPGFKGTPKYEGFSAQAPQGFSGGARGISIVLTKDDLKRAEEQTTKAAFNELKDEISKSVPTGFTSPEELRMVEITRVEAPVAGTHQEKFTVSATAHGRALVFRPEDAESLMKALALGATQDKNQEVVGGSARMTYRARNIDFTKGRADVTISGTVQIKAIVHQDALAALAAGKKQGSISEALRSRPEVSAFTLSLFPPWRSRAPGDTAKIHFVVE